MATIKRFEEVSYRVLFEYNSDGKKGNYYPYGNKKTFWTGTDEDFDTESQAIAHARNYHDSFARLYKPTGRFKVTRCESIEIHINSESRIMKC